jgi:hypothetical protein
LITYTNVMHGNKVKFPRDAQVQRVGALLRTKQKVFQLENSCLTRIFTTVRPNKNHNSSKFSICEMLRYPTHLFLHICKYRSLYFLRFFSSIFLFPVRSQVSLRIKITLLFTRFLFVVVSLAGNATFVASCVGWTRQNDSLHLEPILGQRILRVALIGSPETLGRLLRPHRSNRVCKSNNNINVIGIKL